MTNSDLQRCLIYDAIALEVELYEAACEIEDEILPVGEQQSNLALQIVTDSSENGRGSFHQVVPGLDDLFIQFV